MGETFVMFFGFTPMDEVETALMGWGSDGPAVHKV